jgi:phosphoenolpyruvate synthase/pyruvate phosphate dikinase
MKGLLEFEVETLDLETMPATKTKIMMNVGLPEKAFVEARFPMRGSVWPGRSLSSIPTSASIRWP